ncbi:MAG: dTDP-4-amino-4,6-dideoxygalactose transaminase [Alphaproteobacteria bacterium]|nr:dTDP-4-amino-4,6-dideoxygalactose transaminase [Alphaproteobacteria bacterium]
MVFANFKIPFNKTPLIGHELDYIREAIENKHVAGNGPFTEKCEELLKQETGAGHVLLTTSCTHALELSGLLLNIGPGDEVIVPSFTFVSTANAFAIRGANIVFADIRPDTLNLDESKLESLIRPSTKAIVVVHYAGIGAEMGAICEIAARHNIPVVEDNAHGLFARYKGKTLGTFGVMATQSFHETKNISCGEGGALLINDMSLVPRAEVIRTKGTNRDRFLRGEVDKYTWVDIGSNYTMADLLAAFLWAQLESRKAIQAKRRDIWNAYNNGLLEWASEQDIKLPTVPPECEPSYHLFYMLMPSLEARSAFIEMMKKESIHPVFHYHALNTSEYGKRFANISAPCPVTEDIVDRLVRLPMYHGLSEEGIDAVIGLAKKFSVKTAG